MFLKIWSTEKSDCKDLQTKEPSREETREKTLCFGHTNATVFPVHVDGSILRTFTELNEPSL